MLMNMVILLEPMTHITLFISLEMKNWITASFKDKSLYENATVINKKGKKFEGFLGTGRKLNPTLSMPA